MTEYKSDYEKLRDLAVDYVRQAASEQTSDPQAAAITTACAQVCAITAVASAIDVMNDRFYHINEGVHRLAAAVESMQKYPRLPGRS